MTESERHAFSNELRTANALALELKALPIRAKVAGDAALFHILDTMAVTAATHAAALAALLAHEGENKSESRILVELCN